MPRLEKIKEEAPKNGIVYALYSDRAVVFKKYNSLSEIDYESDSLLELHLFNAKKEYRYVKAKNKQIEVVIDDSIDHADKYEEEIEVDENMNSVIRKIKAVNYIDYTEDDLLTIKNYRLQEVK